MSTETDRNGHRKDDSAAATSEVLAALKERGHSDPDAPLDEREVGIISQTSGLSIIQVLRKRAKHRDRGYHDHDHDHDDDHEHDDDDRKRGKILLIGGADQRRDGAVGGR